MTALAIAVSAVVAFAGPQLAKILLAPEVAVAPVQLLSATGANGGPAKAELSAAGYVVADRQSVLATKYTGVLAKLNVAESQHVKKDELVAEMDHRELDAQIASAQADQAEAGAEAVRLAKAAAQAEAAQAAAAAPLRTLDAEIEQYKIMLADANRRLELDRKLVAGNALGYSEVDDRQTEVRVTEAKIVWTQQRREEALRQMGVAEAQVAVARAAVTVAEAHEKAAGARVKVLREQLEDSFIRAPFDGVVSEKAAEVGEIIAPISIGGSMAKGSVVTLTDWESLQAEVDVAETQIEGVRAGQRAAITVDALHGRIFPGKVRRILPRANRSKATVQVRVDFVARDDKVLPDMGVRVKFLPDDAPAGLETGAVRDKLLVPRAALHGSGPEAYVWTVSSNVAAKRPITAGDSTGETVEITRGLSAGEQVVVRGAEGLSEDRQKVRVAQ
ncbi:MAG: efflux RND transporter periplasmic adaptor subunit [Planctomycetota bacterium]